VEGAENGEHMYESVAEISGKRQKLTQIVKCLLQGIVKCVRGNSRHNTGTNVLRGDSV
jgi:hypothetical protein